MTYKTPHVNLSRIAQDQAAKRATMKQTSKVAESELEKSQKYCFPTSQTPTTNFSNMYSHPQRDLQVKNASAPGPITKLGPVPVFRRDQAKPVFRHHSR